MVAHVMAASARPSGQSSRSMPRASSSSVTMPRRRMDQKAIVEYVDRTFSGLNVMQPTEGPGAFDTFFIYDPERTFEGKQLFPFATIVTKDYTDWDEKSNLNRPGVFRLNVGVGRDTFRSLFSSKSEHDYTALDRLMPHPVYASQSWVS